jgi:methoxymalonate biosynthesis acyl carrier protein
MTKMEIKEKIRAFILRFIKASQLQPDEDIFALGFVTSMFAMQLVLFVEQEFAIKVENEDLEIQNFNTINAITALVESKRAALETVR